MTLLTPLRRSTDPVEFMGRLRDIAEAAIDVVAPQRALRLSLNAEEARVRWELPEFPELELTDGAFSDLGSRLDIPFRYWKRIYQDHFEVAEFTHNHLAQADGRKALFRLLQQGDSWILRAVLSDSYGIFDNFTVLQAVTSGLADAGHDLADAQVQVDLTADRLRMRIMLPQVELLVPELLAGYRFPFDTSRTDNFHVPAPNGHVPPVLWAGIELTNSETGKGAFAIAPRAEFLICRNGLTRTSDIIRQVHLGGKMDEGTVTWSDETRRLNVQLLASKVKDATLQFASVDYLTALAADMRTAATEQVSVSDIDQVRVGHQLTDEETTAVMDAFIRGGQATRLGIAQAVSAAAQLMPDPDRQAEMEAMFLPICAAR